jgi:hypothetical protein
VTRSRTAQDRDVTGADFVRAVAGEAAVGGRRPNRLRRSELVTTDTEENAMAAAAAMGGRIPAAASGIITALYPKAQNRFWMMVR